MAGDGWNPKTPRWLGDGQHGIPVDSKIESLKILCYPWSYKFMYVHIIHIHKYHKSSHPKAHQHVVDESRGHGRRKGQVAHAMMMSLGPFVVRTHGFHQG